MEPRGLRNNNPGNIEYNPVNQWSGQMPHDPTIEARFARFDTPVNGIRAMGRLLLTYSKRYGLTTAEAIIRRWAPDNENNTSAYFHKVEHWLFREAAVKPGSPLNLYNVKVLTELVKAIITYENGGSFYDDAVIDEGIRLALMP